MNRVKHCIDFFLSEGVFAGRANLVERWARYLLGLTLIMLVQTWLDPDFDLFFVWLPAAVAYGWVVGPRLRLWER